MTPYWLHRSFAACQTVAVVTGLALGMVQLTHAQPPSPFVPGPWWRELQKPLAMTDEQSNRLEAVFQAALPYLRHKRDDLQAEEAELSRLIKADADETVIVKQSDRVETIRAALNQSRTLMLVHMRQILTPDQRAKLNTLRDQWERDHPERRPGSSQASPPKNR